MGQLWGWIRQSFSSDGSLIGYAVLLAVIAIVVILLLGFFPPVSQIFMDTYCLQECVNQ